jgi:hypothetical protein
MKIGFKAASFGMKVIILPSSDGSAFLCVCACGTEPLSGSFCRCICHFFSEAVRLLTLVMYGFVPHRSILR